MLFIFKREYYDPSLSYMNMQHVVQVCSRFVVKSLHVRVQGIDNRTAAAR